MTTRQHDSKGEISFRPIGVIRTPYTDWAPYQPVEREDGVGRFQVRVREEYSLGLKDLDRFAYVILLYHLDQAERATQVAVTPPWTKREVGLFASRSPDRPNPIGLSIVRIHKIEGSVIHTWPIDVFDGTPLLDIKPYIASLDRKTDANDGWIDGIEGKEHLLQHVMGIPHDHRDHHHHHDGKEQNGGTGDDLHRAETGPSAAELVRRLEAELADFKARLPAHSVSPAMVQALEEIEERLAAARKKPAAERRTGSASAPAGDHGQ